MAPETQRMTASILFTLRRSWPVSAGDGGSSHSHLRHQRPGQRVAKSVSDASSEEFVYDKAGRLIGEYDGTGNVIEETVWLGNLPVSVRNPRGQYYVNPDYLGAPQSITDKNDNTVWKWDHDPFGNGQPIGTITYNVRFPGQYYDAETGLFYNYFRDYNPAIGRYVQSDPIGLRGGVNTYAYVGGNPVSGFDPNGIMSISDLILNNVPEHLFDKGTEWSLNRYVNISEYWAGIGTAALSGDPLDVFSAAMASTATAKNDTFDYFPTDAVNQINEFYRNPMEDDSVTIYNIIQFFKNKSLPPVAAMHGVTTLPGGPVLQNSRDGQSLDRSKLILRPRSTL